MQSPLTRRRARGRSHRLNGSRRLGWLGHEVSWQAWQDAASAGRRFDVYSRRSSLKIQAAEVKATLSLPRQLLIGSSTYKDRAGASNSSTSAKKTIAQAGATSSWPCNSFPGLKRIVLPMGIATS